MWILEPPAESGRQNPSRVLPLRSEARRREGLAWATKSPGGRSCLVRRQDRDRQTDRIQALRLSNVQLGPTHRRKKIRCCLRPGQGRHSLLSGVCSLGSQAGTDTGGSSAAPTEREVRAFRSHTLYLDHSLSWCRMDRTFSQQLWSDHRLQPAWGQGKGQALGSMTGASSHRTTREAQL